MSKDNHGSLEPPARTSIDDPGAHDLESSDSDDHFSDAHSGPEHSGRTSPAIPLTRVEKVENESSHGEVPGTGASAMRESDAELDEVAVIPEEEDTKPIPRSTTPGGHPIPRTLVEKVDPSSPSYGEVPGTLAHEKHAVDAVPDMVVKTGDRSRSSSTVSRAGSTPGDLPIPITKVEKVDSGPSHGEIPGTKAFNLRKEDAEPDIVEEVRDNPASPSSRGVRSQITNHARRKSSGAGRKAPSTTTNYTEEEDGEEDGFGDDFDDFEEGEEDAEFGDFDDGFQEPEPTPPPPPQPKPPSFASRSPILSDIMPNCLQPVLNFAELDSSEDIYAATEPYLNSLFPPDTIDTSVLPPVSAENPIFLTPRSASLWSQLVAPPPLQPPNWIRSRIRRLFLVSLGVPVDLDEILPASKQKKLILPSIHLNPSSGSPRNSTDSRSISRLKQSDGNASSTSVDSQGKPSRSDSRRRRGPPPAPQLDLVSARQLCTITDEALNGLTIAELKEHVGKLEEMEGTAKEVLEYWTKRTDEKLGDREAFEGVIENLVKHARKVRK